MSKISLIIQTLNNEATLPACLESIKQQSFTNWEAVIIDEGSKDNSLVIAEKFSHADERIKVALIDKTSKKMLEDIIDKHCTGEFILFVEPNGTLKANALADSINLAKATNSDIILFEWLNKTKKGLEPLIIKYKLRNEHRLLVQDILSNRQPAQLWNKLFKRSLWYGIDLKQTSEQMVKTIFQKSTKVFYLNKAECIHVVS